MGELRGRAFFAYLIVCIVWGSTYLAIRVGVEHLPPFLFAGVRFLVAGIVLAAIARALGESFPVRRRDWKVLAITGVLFLTSGNGLVVWAEQYLDAGTASIYVVTVAIWAACFDAYPGGKTRLSWRCRRTGPGSGTVIRPRQARQILPVTFAVRSADCRQRLLCLFQRSSAQPCPPVLEFAPSICSPAGLLFAIGLLGRRTVLHTNAAGPRPRLLIVFGSSSFTPTLRLRPLATVVVPKPM